MLKINKEYTMKELAQELGIPENQYKVRKQELLQWFDSFFDFDIIKERPLTLFIREQYIEYQPLPRKGQEQSLKRKQEMIKDYTLFTIAAMGTEFKPNSGSKIAREAIDDFGSERYQHSDYKNVAQKFIRPAMQEYGESSRETVWVWSDTYKELTVEELNFLAQTFNENKMTEIDRLHMFDEAASATDEAESNFLFQKARIKYRAVLDIIKEKYGAVPVKVRYWKVKEAGAGI